MSSFLPKTKWGSCTRCDKTDCACVKIGKDLVCVECNRKEKTEKQIAKSQERNKIRSLTVSTQTKSGYVPADDKLVDNKAAKEFRELVAKKKWFEERRKEMTGKCLFCSGKTEKFNDATFRHSIAHLLPKKDNFGGFPSVATHEDNWIELCYYGNSCHTNFDNAMITLEQLKDTPQWEVIVRKFKKVYPFIAEKEKRNIHYLLLQEL